MYDKSCDCKEFRIIKGEVVCAKCKQPMKSEQKSITNKGRRFTQGNGKRK